MPVYNETHDVAKPAGTRDISLGDDDIREYKRAMDERLNTDHIKPNDETGFTTVGYHRKVTLVDLVSNPTPISGIGIVFSKNIGGGVIELFYMDAAGNVTQLTQAGKIMSLGGEGWRTGDKILSSNTATPSGWTDISSTYTDHFIRISSSTPLTTGGANTHTHGAGSYAHSHTHSTTVLNTGWGAGGGVDGSGLLATKTANVFGSTGSQAFTSGAPSSDAVTGTSASSDNVPVYVQMKMYSKT